MKLLDNIYNSCSSTCVLFIVLRYIQAHINSAKKKVSVLVSLVKGWSKTFSEFSIQDPSNGRQTITPGKYHEQRVTWECRDRRLGKWLIFFFFVSGNSSPILVERTTNLCSTANIVVNAWPDSFIQFLSVNLYQYHCTYKTATLSTGSFFQELFPNSLSLSCSSDFAHVTQNSVLPNVRQNWIPSFYVIRKKSRFVWICLKKKVKGKNLFRRDCF